MKPAIAKNSLSVPFEVANGQHPIRILAIRYPRTVLNRWTKKNCGGGAFWHCFSRKQVKARNGQRFYR
jgi:hypothetical protein